MPPPPTLTAPSTPPPKDVPWWGALILAIVVCIVSVVGTIYARAPAAPGAGQVSPGIGKLFTDSVLFLPHVLILFGVFADIFTLQGAYSIPSLVGLLSIPLNFIFSFFWGGIASVLAGAVAIVTNQVLPAAAAAPLGAATAADWGGYEISGFESLSSSYAPQGLVVTSTIFWYYLLDLLMNRDILDTTFTWGAFILSFGLQTSMLTSTKNMQGALLIKAFIAMMEGFIVGGLGYGIVQATIPSRLPSAILPSGPNLSSLTKNADGSYTDSSGKKYIVGPDGRPLASSFLQAAAQAAAPATQTTCSASGS